MSGSTSLRQFSLLTPDDVVDAVQRLPDKASAADSISTHELKQVVDLIAPYIADVFNRSLYLGRFLRY